jgi:hypothetical protein
MAARELVMPSLTGVDTENDTSYACAPLAGWLAASLGNLGNTETSGDFLFFDFFDFDRWMEQEEQVIHVESLENGARRYRSIEFGFYTDIPAHTIRYMYFRISNQWRGEG